MKLFSRKVSKNRQEQTEELLSGLLTLKRLVAKVGRQSSIPPAHIHILVMLEEQEISTMSQVAEKLCVSRGAATQILDSMTEQGLVNRQPDQHDRRVVRLKLTAKSRKILQQSKRQIESAFTEMFANLNDQELAEYNRLTQKIINLERHDQ